MKKEWNDPKLTNLSVQNTYTTMQCKKCGTYFNNATDLYNHITFDTPHCIIRIS